MWEAGKVPELLHETRRCDKQIVSGLSPMTPEQLERTFNRLMMEGKVRSAVRLMTDVVVVAFFPQRAKAHGKNGRLGISIYDVVKEKHPVQRTVDLSAFLGCEELPPLEHACGHHRCPYRRSSGTSIWTRNPSGTISEQWRAFILRYETASPRLREALAASTHRHAN